MSNTGVCKLCGQQSLLRASHVIPRFAIDWMRKTGGSFFRGSEDEKKRLQDGPKRRMLCDNCEQRFSAREMYFRETVFGPYLSDTNQAIEYDEQLFYFCISIAWRVLRCDLDDGELRNHAFCSDLNKAEQAWRLFLQDGSLPQDYDEVHLFMTEILTQATHAPPQLNLYLARAFDATIASSSQSCAVYWKFSRFVAFAAIKPFDQRLWIRTRVNPNGGVLQHPQKILDDRYGGFLLGRAQIASKSAQRKLNPKQEEFHAKRQGNPHGGFVGSDLEAVLRADAANSYALHQRIPGLKEDDACPCGSAQRFGSCHGAE